MNPLHTTAKTSDQGFTLLELLVVVIMVGVLAAIAAPGWLTFLNRQRVTAVRSDLIETLKLTQQDAIQRRQSRQLKVIETATTPTVQIGPLGTTGFSQVLGGDTNNRGGVQLNAFRFEADGSKDTTVDTIAFNYQGLPTDRENLPFVITVTTANAGVKQCVIVASLLGSLKTASGDTCDNPNVAAQ